MALQSTLGALLWARSTSTERANAFLRAIEPEAKVAVYGHDVARAGYAVEWHSYPMPHSLCEPEVRDLRQWLAARVR